jgi:hypothetical protein
MNPRRFFTRLAIRIVNSWGKPPTRKDIDAVKTQLLSDPRFQAHAEFLARHRRLVDHTRACQQAETAKAALEARRKVWHYSRHQKQIKPAA